MVLTLICTWNQSNLNTRAKGFFSPFWHNCYTVWLFMCMNCRYCKILHGFILWICKLCFCRAFKKVLYLILYHEICYITICWITRRLRFVLSHETYFILLHCIRFTILAFCFILLPVEWWGNFVLKFIFSPKCFIYNLSLQNLVL